MSISGNFRKEEPHDKKQYTLLGEDGRFYQSINPGTLAGNGRSKIYGRFDCPSALRAIRQGGYVEHRVFFADERTAIFAGYRPCGTCLKKQYTQWKATRR
ncbi:Metal binding domain of Ada [Fictibacillus enclensis]|uniref:Metal-binding protein n=1 Tax=Fictibacillus enclensis TaxID=1017270 RepID=A0A0V8JFQ4_9BACL|nr:Ada metal-binding domain-containing protein [Fictibacillus enclensis]KSU85876.1 metal-binding protein [Fictibacillus enclensis]SCC04347.1 Metal binding domain of Ada [Fictibacillus enclensis]